MADVVTIPPVRTFETSVADKAHALKPLEEAAEVYGEWQKWDAICGTAGEGYARRLVVDECCDTIMATCNLLAALGVTDLTEAMAKCEERNRERGRYE